MKWKILSLLLSLLMIFSLNAQEKVVLEGKQVKLMYQSISGLIVVKANLNGYKNLNFILDTGSNGIIVFKDVFFSPSQLRSANDLSIRGLGSDSLLTAKLVHNNTLKLHNRLYGEQLKVFLITENEFSLGAKYGFRVHGIIGNDYFRALNLGLNYQNQKIRVSHELHKIHKYKKTDAEFHLNKPFLQLSDNFNNDYPVLMDSGGVDALWLFDTEIDWHSKPHIRDFLGFGLSGEVIGNRIRKDSIYFQNEYFDKMYVAVPDTIYTNYIKKIYPSRKGSVGAQFLKRFNWVIDYQNQEIYYRPNRFRKEEFSYNVTGMEVFQPVEALRIYVIESILKDSAADHAGLFANDIIRSVNGKNVNELTLHDIYSSLQNHKAKKMTITVERNGQRIYTEIPLWDILNN